MISLNENKLKYLLLVELSTNKIKSVSSHFPHAINKLNKFTINKKEKTRKKSSNNKSSFKNKLKKIY